MVYFHFPFSTHAPTTIPDRNGQVSTMSYQLVTPGSNLMLLEKDESFYLFAVDKDPMMSYLY